MYKQWFFKKLDRVFNVHVVCLSKTHSLILKHTNIYVQEDEGDPEDFF